MERENSKDTTTSGPTSFKSDKVLPYKIDQRELKAAAASIPTFFDKERERKQRESRRR